MLNQCLHTSCRCMSWFCSLFLCSRYKRTQQSLTMISILLITGNKQSGSDFKSANQNHMSAFLLPLFHAKHKYWESKTHVVHHKAGNAALHLPSVHYTPHQPQNKPTEREGEREGEKFHNFANNHSLGQSAMKLSESHMDVHLELIHFWS